MDVHWAKFCYCGPIQYRFLLVNKRTKETRYYQINGADESSAMGSAEGKVQEKEYVATFPILINVAERPTYFVS